MITEYEEIKTSEQLTDGQLDIGTKTRIFERYLFGFIPLIKSKSTATIEREYFTCQSQKAVGFKKDKEK